MASWSYSNRESIPRDALISSGTVPRSCTVWVDAGCWTMESRPPELAGVLDLPRAEFEALANSDRLILTLSDSGELYRMIIDAGTGRFIARKL